MNLFQEFEERKIDYNNISIEGTVPNYDYVDISIIIPVHGRVQFNNIITDAFYKAKSQVDLNISLTFVEHSEKPEHFSLCKDWVDHIWINQNKQKFNKCLCFNIGIIHGPNAKYYLFHDSDILVPEDYFVRLMENMEGKDAVQTFTKQRLLHCTPPLTDEILNRKVSVNDLHINYPGVQAARPGAEGGSVFVKHDLIKQGCIFPDWGFDEYSVEDSCYFRYLELIGKVGFCNEPPIELYHMYHSPSFNRQTKDSDWQRYYAFMAMNEEGKRHLIKLQAEHFNKYYAS